MNNSTNKTFGKIEDGTLFFKGKYYKIRYVSNGVIVLDTDKLFGRWGDEFPLELVK